VRELGIRLQKYLARCGLGSRRKCEELIAAGRIAVNGSVVTEPGSKVEGGDTVSFDDSPILPLGYRYYILNKPKGYISVDQDLRGRPYVVDLIPGAREAGCFPVGRLDIDTTGLLLITNDGELSQRIAHPRHGIEKTYEALLPGKVLSSMVRDLERGATLEDGHFVSGIRIGRIERMGPDTLVRITIHEGKRHVVKRIFRSIGVRVKALHRHSIGALTLGSLRVGEWRDAGKEEIDERCRIQQ
jgi:23S rRNA pseudouridine2605 synthase